ncbi:UbiX family flavin prenyltransferase [Reyranella sp. CPCC 100927]|uniref:UbiX family flavin prenyltransferase n=1 Tax=Reyranella sp. CPCC 100927 TaxID=2599616 RepID=UPI0011B4DD29|nr:UbiX family flavin prenyltransferase [Reyranella sp. CPCC 100927]TWS96810.1 UbiX family flavin prenyltransferase [Reyranella sp. CPCC 100927]
MTYPARLIIGISGASGVIHGVRLLQLLQPLPIETHLVMTKTAEVTLAHETDWKVKDVKTLADHVHAPGDLAAPISSGSFKTMGMVIAPCSMRSLGEIATGISSSLLTRAADVVLKERRKLVLLPRETPLHAVHLRNMATVAELGAIIAPPLPAFYNRPQTIEDIVNHTAGRVLDLFDIDPGVVKRWGESG